MPKTEYYWDFANDNFLMEETEGEIAAVYVTEPKRFGSLISQHRANETSYYHFDGIGSTRQLTSNSGTVTDSMTYSAYGDEISTSGNTPNPFRFKGIGGYYSDLTTNTIYVRARTYSPFECRWLTPDPLTFGSKAIYLYTNSDPINTIDPTGLITEYFSRPTDNPYEFVDEADHFGYPVPAGAEHIPWETAWIKVTVTADASDCYRVFVDLENNARNCDCTCLGKISLKFDYSATITSYNPTSRDDPAVQAEGFVIEIQGSGVFLDKACPFTVKKGTGGGRDWNINSVVSGTCSHYVDCGNCWKDTWRSQQYKIRGEPESGIGTLFEYWLEPIDQIYTYKWLHGRCDSKIKKETLTGVAGSAMANGPLRQVPPNQRYPKSPLN